MAPENFNLGAAAFYISSSCLIALAISLLFIKQLFISPKRSKSCYLNTERKPQHTFKRILADNSYSQFKHLKLQIPDDEELHPYKSEVSKLMKNPDVGFLEGYERGVLEMRGSHVWVETETQLKEVAKVLSREKVFGVDTEQHSFRSFLGFTALIQISTTCDDYLVDTIALHDVMGLLRPVFANPGICKVFHGGDSDVLWLQRDFHIYVVNLFDTAKACDILSKPQRSLAYLLETYCSVSANKLLQREDWRQRPLPEEMIHYARADAHYLLYIAYCLCLELRQQKNENSSPGDKSHFLLEASRRSNATCLQLFSKDIEAGPGELAASSIISRCLNGQGHISSSLCDAKFQELVRQLCLWRDIMARLHDESLRFVLSENAIISLASEIPTTEKDICSTISKADGDLESVSQQSPSPLVCCHLDDLTSLLREKTVFTENIIHHFIQQHLAGNCPLSVYNYDLLSKTRVGLNHTPTMNRNGFRASKKTSQELFVKRFLCKSPVYHNCKIYANDGQLLGYCDRKRLEWYVNRKMAKLVEDNPWSIMLLFEPKGRPEDDDNKLQSKENICVGCGEGKHYLRYRIIPSCYRVHLKCHGSQDIQAATIGVELYRLAVGTCVLVCVDCHDAAHAAAEKYKRQVAAEFGIPLTSCKMASEEIAISPSRLRYAAVTLLQHGPHMPSERREEYLQIVRTYYGVREVSDEDLERALVDGKTRKGGKTPQERHGTHGKQVVTYLVKEYGEDGVREFCQRWRRVFVEAIHPRFLPAGWDDVMHSGKTDVVNKLSLAG